MVMFRVNGTHLQLDDAPATVLAENLRIKAARFHDGEGVEGARDVADMIEHALVGNIDLAIGLEGAGAEAVYYVLDKDPSAAAEGPIRDLYLAVRELHIAETWPPEDALAIRLRLGSKASHTSYITPESARELINRLRKLQTAMGSAQHVAMAVEQLLATTPVDRLPITLFGEQATTILNAIDAWELEGAVPDDVAKLRTALESN